MVKRSNSLVFFSLFALLVAVANASSHHHAKEPSPPSTDCSSIIYDMADCVSYVSMGSTESKPSKECCNGLKTVLKTDPECLCEAFKASADMGIVLDISRALGLPTACAESAPDLHDCGLSNGPSPSPANAPSEPTLPPQAAPSPSEQTPDASAPAPNAASSTYFPAIITIVCLILASL